MAATTTTTAIPPRDYHNVPVQEEVDYSKGVAYPTSATTGYPSTTTTSYTNPAYSNPAYVSSTQTTSPNYQSLGQTIPNVSIFLRPIAAPSALGWMGFFGGTFMVFTWYASWYGDNTTYLDIAPFVFFFGGLCQLVAGFMGYNARDNFATVFFPLWGSFYLAWSYYMVRLESIRFANSAFPVAPIDKFLENDGLGMWFVILCAISWACFIPSMARDITTALIVLLTAIGATLNMAFFSHRTGSTSTIKAGAYFLIIASVLAGFRSMLYLLEEAFYETPLATRFIPKYRSPLIAENRPPVSVGVNEPGVRKGQ